MTLTRDRAIEVEFSDRRSMPWIHTIQGYRIISGQSRESMMALVLNMTRTALIVTATKGCSVASVATIDVAIGKSMGICTTSGDPNCHIFYSACSLPARIQ